MQKQQNIVLIYIYIYYYKLLKFICISKTQLTKQVKKHSKNCHLVTYITKVFKLSLFMAKLD